MKTYARPNLFLEWQFLALVTAAIVVGFLMPSAMAAVAPAEATAWTPASSERLVKLPASYLKKAVEQDFAKSSLAATLSDTDNQVRLKVQTLEDLRGAIDQAEGELRIELSHQFLAEKREYLKMIARHQKLRKRRAKTKIRLYERILGKIRRKRGSMTPQRVALVQKQDEARQRFEASVAKVDARLFRTSITTESRYAREYAKNVSAIERLMAAINSHPMGAQAELDGTPVSKEDLIRQLIAEDEAELAILEQERSVLGFMAKLVALDALALTEAVIGDDPTQDQADGANHALVNVVDYFVTQ